MGAAEVALVALFERPPLALGDEHDFLVFEFGEAGDDRPVVAEGLVAVQFDELVEHEFDVIEGLRAFEMPRDLDDVPRIEVLENLPFHPRDLDPHFADGIFRVGGGVGLSFEFFELAFEFVNGPLERKMVRSRHALIVRSQWSVVRCEFAFIVSGRLMQDEGFFRQSERPGTLWVASRRS